MPVSSLSSCSLCIVFFFQAEDGIRDGTVTGVQTCALPISKSGETPSPVTGEKEATPAIMSLGVKLSVSSARSSGVWRLTVGRSEERRVGKECRSRRSPYHEKKKNIHNT